MVSEAYGRRQRYFKKTDARDPEAELREAMAKAKVASEARQNDSDDSLHAASSSSSSYSASASTSTLSSSNGSSFESTGFSDSLGAAVASGSDHGDSNRFSSNAEFGTGFYSGLSTSTSTSSSLRSTLSASSVENGLEVHTGSQFGQAIKANETNKGEKEQEELSKTKQFIYEPLSDTHRFTDTSGTSTTSSEPKLDVYAPKHREDVDLKSYSSTRAEEIAKVWEERAKEVYKVPEDSVYKATNRGQKINADLEAVESPVAPRYSNSKINAIRERENQPHNPHYNPLSASEEVIAVESTLTKKPAQEPARDSGPKAMILTRQRDGKGRSSSYGYSSNIPVEGYGGDMDTKDYTRSPTMRDVAGTVEKPKQDFSIFDPDYVATHNAEKEIDLENEDWDDGNGHNKFMRTQLSQSNVPGNSYDSNDPWNLKRQSYTGKAPSRRAYYGEDDDNNGKPTSPTELFIFILIFIVIFVFSVIFK